MGLMGVPESLAEEHEAIFGELRVFAKRDDRVGEAVRDLLRALEPHFEQEDELAMPLLGALRPLSSGKVEGDLNEVISLQSKLAKALPSMLSEHKVILGFIEKAKKEAAKAKLVEVVDSLGGLEHHAKVEEEVLYPAAMLVGVFAKALSK